MSCSAPVFVCCLRAPTTCTEQRKEKGAPRKSCHQDSRGRELAQTGCVVGAVLAALENGFRLFKVDNSSKRFDARWTQTRGYDLQGYSLARPFEQVSRPCVRVRSCTAGDRCKMYRLGQSDRAGSEASVAHGKSARQPDGRKLVIQKFDVQVEIRC